MLVQNDVAPEKFAKENEGSIFQKADPMTGDRQISCIGMMNQKLPKDAQEGGNEPQSFPEQQDSGEFVHLVISSGGG